MSSTDFKSVSELWVTSFVRLCVCYMYIPAHPEGSAGDVTLTSVSLQLISVLLLTSAGTREGGGLLPLKPQASTASVGLPHVVGRSHSHF